MIPYKWDDPSDELRRVTSKLMAQYIRPRPYILEQVERFYRAELAGSPAIGVHIRGTDSISNQEHRPFRRNSLRFDRYAEAVERLLGETPAAKIFVATDAEASLDFMKTRFGNRVVAHDSLRHVAGKAAGRGPRGWLMPAYFTRDPETAARNGKEAVIEYLLLRRCDSLVHNGSNLARTVLLADPAKPHINTNRRNRWIANLRALSVQSIRDLLGEIRREIRRVRKRSQQP